MKTVLGIDPGPTTSGVIHFDGIRALYSCGAHDNALLCEKLQRGEFAEAAVVIEKVQYYRTKVANGHVFDTCRWSGRFHQAAETGGHTVQLLPWPDVKREFALSGEWKTTNEAAIRRLMLEKFGGASAKGTKKTPGPMFGVTAHAWSALALAVFWWQRASGVGLVPAMKVAPEPALMKALKDIAEVDF